MRILFASLALAATCCALTAPKRKGGPRVVSLNIQRGEVEDAIEHDRNRLRRRSSPLDLTVDNNQALYLLNATVGTPPQQVRLHVDTGSSDLWVNSAQSTFCRSQQDPCSATGTYSANQSSTYRYLNSAFDISYQDGSGASGDYVADTLRVTGAQLMDFQFGVGYTSSSEQNVLGIGYRANEVQAAKSNLGTYDNLPAALSAGGTIASNAYSLWLDDLDSNTGRLLLGGVDTTRYRGNLVTLPVQKTGDVYTAFYVTMTGLSVGSTSVADNLALAVLLDSGTSLTYLPNNITAAIYDQVNATYQPTQGVGTIPCSAAQQQGGNLTFRFSDPAAVSVPMSEMVLSLGNSSQGQGFGSAGNDPVCLFGIVPSSDSNVVLGDTFMRSAYVVFDLDSNEVSIAQSNVNATGAGNVVEIQRGRALPSSVRPKNPVPATGGLPTQSGGASTRWSMVLLSVMVVISI